MVIYLFLSLLRTFISVLLFIMFVRAIMSWIPDFAGTPLHEFVTTLTEWVIMPVRAVMEAFGFQNKTIFDIPYFVTVILLSLARSLLT